MCETYRHELKFHINEADRLLLRTRLGVVCKPDENVVSDNGYHVRSLYFDNYDDKALREKIDGVNDREKFRIRYYNGDTSFIRLEKKSKLNGLCQKRSAPVTAAQCTALIAGDTSFLKLPGSDPLSRNSTQKCSTSSSAPGR